MNVTKLRQIFERLDQALKHPTEMLVQGGVQDPPLRHRGSFVNEEAVRPSRWEPVLQQMFEELRSGAPRAEAVDSNDLTS